MTKIATVKGSINFVKGLGCATLILTLLLSGCSQTDIQQPRLPRISTSNLVADGYLTSQQIDESSGLVQSQQYPGVFWTHNDSGDSPRLFAVRADGSLIRPDDGLPYDGIQVEGAVNRDWEDITYVPVNRLLISDLGNNANRRRDLMLYLVPEPNPYRDRVARVERKQPVYYPEQKEFPPAENNFDCEAVFYWERGFCFLTKHRADVFSTLYQLPGLSPEETMLPLNIVQKYDLGGKVTAADSYEGRIAVLTYNTVWVFEPKHSKKSTDTLELFSGPVWWKPIRAGQCESVAFIDEDTLLIGNEQRDLFQLKLTSMSQVSR